MEIKNLNVSFFFLLLVGISILTFFIFKPFFVAILLAAILAVVFQTPFKFFLRITGERKKISAFLTALLGMILFTAVFVGLVGLIANEVSTLLKGISIESGAGGQSYADDLVSKINANPALRLVGVDNLINKETIGKSAAQISQGTITIIQKTYQSVANFLFLTFVMFFTLYYFLVSGKNLVKHIMYLSPLRDTHEKMLIEKFISMSRATIKGNLIIAMIQGSIGAILFSAVGVHSALIWGVVMMFFSLIPMFGTAFVWLPIGITMIVLGHVWQGVTILAVGGSLISLIDNFLSPKLIGKDTQMHPLIVFFAILGGISMFGFLGFIIGPIIVALFLTLWEIYAVEFKGQLRKYNT